MDPLTIFLVTFVARQIDSFTFGSRLSWQRRSPYPDCLLRVYDVDLGNNKEVNVRATVNTQAELQEYLVQLPAQVPTSIRIYIEDGCEIDENFQNHLAQVGVRTSNPHRSETPGGFSDLCSQWSALTEKKSWLVVSHELIVPEDLWPEALYGVVGGAEAFLAGLIRFERSVRLVESPEGHITGMWSPIGLHQLTFPIKL